MADRDNTQMNSLLRFRDNNLFIILCISKRFYWPRGLRPSGRSPAGIVGSNPTRGNGCFFVVCCQVEVSVTS